MAAITTYVDVGGSPSELAVAPAAIVATAEKWVAFEKAWNECLDVYGVTALHMKHFAHNRGEFLWRNDEPKRRRFLNNLLWIMEEFIEFTATEAVYIKEYNQFDATHKLSESMRPYTMGCLAVAGSVMKWAKQNGHDKAGLIWIFEKGDQDQADLKKHWDIAYPDGAVDPIFLKKTDKYPDPQMCKRIRPFEAADFIAYENLKAHKLLDESEDDVYLDQLRRPMQRMKESLTGADKWAFFGAERIGRICSSWNIPSR